MKHLTWSLSIHGILQAIKQANISGDIGNTSTRRLHFSVFFCFPSLLLFLRLPFFRLNDFDVQRVCQYSGNPGQLVQLCHMPNL